MSAAISKNGSGSLQRENSDRALYRNAADALAKSQIFLQASKEALLLLDNRKSAEQIGNQIHFVSSLRFQLKESFAEQFSESEAQKLFELPSVPSGGRRDQPA